MRYEFVDFYIPERMMEGVLLYVEKGVVPGDFLVAVIQNNLKEAVGRADTENMRNLPAFVGYFYNETPLACWGSKEKMEAWVAQFRKEREEEEEEKVLEGEDELPQIIDKSEGL